MEAAAIHARVREIITKHGLIRPADWLNGVSHNGVRVKSVYLQVYKQKVKGKPFFGCDNWYSYLRKFHGVERPTQGIVKENRTDAEIHALVNEAIQKTGLTAAADWLDKTAEHNGMKLHSLYRLVHSKKRNRKAFFGHGTWDRYLEAKHGIVSLKKLRVSDEQLHYLIGRAIQKTKDHTAGHWTLQKRTLPEIGRSLAALLHLAMHRRVNRKNFFGHGTWDNYLEKVHGIVPVNQRFWSDERLHSTIARLAKRFPPRRVNWKRQEEVVAHGRSLRGLYLSAAYGNKPREKSPRNFFGHGTWEEYLKWAKKGI